MNTSDPAQTVLETAEFQEALESRIGKLIPLIRHVRIAKAAHKRATEITRLTDGRRQNRQGTITPEEQDEYEAFLSVAIINYHNCFASSIGTKLGTKALFGRDPDLLEKHVEITAYRNTVVGHTLKHWSRTWAPHAEAIDGEIAIAFDRSEAANVQPNVAAALGELLVPVSNEIGRITIEKMQSLLDEFDVPVRFMNESEHVQPQVPWA